MKYIIDFYKGLDAVNIFIFWGVIGVVLLLLIFSIIMANKNRKLERIIESQGMEIDDNDSGLAIKKTDELITKKDNVKAENAINKTSRFEKTTAKEETKTDNNDIDTNIVIKRQNEVSINEENKGNVLEKKITNIDINEFPQIEIDDKKDMETAITKSQMPVEEKEFIAEEHVMEYNKDFFDIPTINKQSETKNVTKESNIIYTDELDKKDITKKEMSESSINTIPYHKNILREVYPSQTSPIGVITKKETHIKNEVNNAKELNEIINSEQIINNDNYSKKELTESREINNYIKPQQIKSEPQRRGNYLDELSKKMSENNAENNIDRTSYEIQQEQDAIISYKELMQKKDNIKMIDEEEAVISIEELTRRKHEKEKIYNITEKEPNDDFISELKNFRSDL